MNVNMMPTITVHLKLSVSLFIYPFVVSNLYDLIFKAFKNTIKI